jgi:DNA-binding XRE family transcriptional regulator
MSKYTARMIFQDFREAYPYLWRRGADYELCDFMTIRIRIPTIGVVEYEYFGNKLTWLERWVDPNLDRKRDKDNRYVWYEEFVKLIESHMDDYGYTQQDIADISGLSRKSINEYLTGRSIPKVSTMRKICESLRINFY